MPHRLTHPGVYIFKSELADQLGVAPSPRASWQWIMYTVYHNGSTSTDLCLNFEDARVSGSHQARRLKLQLRHIRPRDLR